MTTTFTLTGRLLDDSKQPAKRRTLSLRAYPELRSDGTADETYIETPSLITDDDGNICRRVNGEPYATPGVELIAGPGQQYSIKTSSGSLRHPLYFDAPASGTLDLSNIVPAPPTPPATWQTWLAAIDVRLDALEAGGGGGGAVASVNGETGVVVLDAADVGAKPSTYVPAWSEVTGKPSIPDSPDDIGAEVAGAAATAQSAAATDATNKVATEQSRAQAAEATKVNSSTYTAGMANKADLVGGLVPGSQLPSFVDDVLEFANLAAFPATGESGKIYVAQDTNKTYRWAGSSYVVIADGVALGETSSTAYRGDRGKTAYDFSQAPANQRGGVSGVAPLGSDQKVPDSSLPDRLADASLTTAFATAIDGVITETGAADGNVAVYDAGLGKFKPGPAPSSVPTKTIRVPISADGGSNPDTTFTDICQRSVLCFPAPTTRWRLRVRNASAYFNTAYTGALSFKDIYVGPPSIATDGTWSGAFSSAPTLATTGGSTPSDGSEWVSGWVTAAGAQFAADVPQAISWAFTCGAGQSLASGRSHVARTYYGTGAAALVNATAAPGGPVGVGYLLADVRVEAEFLTNLPVELVIGDSVASGNMDDTNLAPAIEGPANGTWPGMRSLAKRSLVINGGVGGAEYGSFTSTSWAWQRLGIGSGATIPDRTILACGINEANVLSRSLATFMTNLLAVKTLLRGAGCQQFAVATVLALPVFNPSQLRDGAAIGATTITTTALHASGTVLSLDYGNSNSETVTTSGTPTGTGPYVTTLTGATTKAHVAGALVAAAGSEQLRQSYNAAIRLGKAGPLPVIEFDAAIDPARKREIYGTAVVHPGAGAPPLLVARAAVV